MSAGPTTGAEQYTYSIAWLAFGVVLLGIGILFNSQRARLASAVVIGLTILKAFLIDMSTLTGVYRAVIHVPRPGAGGDRLAVPADPVPQASGIAAACAEGRLGAQAALTELRNLPTSSLSRLLSLDSDFAAE
jgi:hypothetical protein